jgi:hypothetical protein
MHYKPAGYTSVAPYLVVSDAKATIAFLQAAPPCRSRCRRMIRIDARASVMLGGTTWWIATRVG